MSHEIPGDLRERYADDLYERVNFTLVRDFNYGGFERAVSDSDELEATRVVAKELFVEKATLSAATESMRFERDESRAASRQALRQWHEANERIDKMDRELREAKLENERLRDCIERVKSSMEVIPWSARSPREDAYIKEFDLAIAARTKEGPC